MRNLDPTHTFFWHNFSLRVLSGEKGWEGEENALRDETNPCSCEGDYSRSWKAQLVTPLFAITRWLGFQREKEDWNQSTTAHTYLVLQSFKVVAFTRNCFTKDLISSYSISVFMFHIIDILSQTNGQVENEECRVRSVECGKQEIVEMRSVEKK